MGRLDFDLDFISLLYTAKGDSVAPKRKVGEDLPPGDYMFLKKVEVECHSLPAFRVP